MRIDRGNQIILSKPVPVPYFPSQILHYKTRDQIKTDTLRSRHVWYERGYNTAFIFLHVHPLPGNVFVNKFPRRPILGKQSVARLFSNREGCVFYLVRAKQTVERCMQPLIGNGTVNMSTVRCFPWDLYRVLIGQVNSNSSSVQGSYEWIVAAEAREQSELGLGV
jgi:hypothetical protein